MDKAWKAFFNWLFKDVPILEYYPSSAKILFCGTAALLAIAVAVFLILYGSASRALRNSVADKQLPTLVKAAQKAGRKYVIESISMNVHLGDQTTLPRVAEGTITYTLFGISDAGTSPQDFIEGFHTTEIDGGESAEVFQLPGTDDDLESAAVGTENTKSSKSWPVDTNLGLGERRTVSTSVRWSYNFPNPPSRAVHMFPRLASNEDAFCYPNEEDVVGQLTIAISADFPLKPPEEGDAKREPASTFVSSMPILRSTSGRAMVSFTWMDVDPHTTTGLRVRW